jgi:hypothetical protein
MVAPVGDLLHNGVSLVPQFLWKGQNKIQHEDDRCGRLVTYWQTWPTAAFTGSHIDSVGLVLGTGLGLVAFRELAGLVDRAVSTVFRSSSE